MRRRYVYFAVKPFKFHVFFLFSFFFFFFERERKFARWKDKKVWESLAPKYFWAFNKKRLPLFDKSLMTLEHLHQTVLFKGMRFCSVFGSNHKKVFGKLIKKPLPESILNNLDFPKNVFHHRRFPANFLKVFRKRRAATY